MTDKTFCPKCKSENTQILRPIKQDGTIEELVLTAKTKIPVKSERTGEIQGEYFSWLMKGHMCKNCRTMFAVADTTVPKMIRKGDEING